MDLIEKLSSQKDDLLKLLTAAQEHKDTMKQLVKYYQEGDYMGM